MGLIGSRRTGRSGTDRGRRRHFHGRTTTIVSFSDDPDARADYGPYTPGFVTVPYGDLDALRAAITDDTVAVLLEPIQGEAGVPDPAAGIPAGRTGG